MIYLACRTGSRGIAVEGLTPMQFRELNCPDLQVDILH